MFHPIAMRPRRHRFSPLTALLVSVLTLGGTPGLAQQPDPPQSTAPPQQPTANPDTPPQAVENDGSEGGERVEEDDGGAEGSNSENEGQPGNEGSGSADAAEPDLSPSDEPNGAPSDTPADEPGLGRFIPMPELNHTQLGELIDIVLANARGELGYREARTVPRRIFTATPEQLDEVYRLVADRPGEPPRYLEVGFRSFASQPPHLWLFTASRPAQPEASGEQLDRMQQLFEQAEQVRVQRAERLTVDDLASRQLNLSYIELDRCLGMLKALGYNVVEYTIDGEAASGSRIINPTSSVDPQSLPIVMPLPASERTMMVGGDYTDNALSQANDLPRSGSAPLSQLIIFYDPASPEAFAELRTLIRDEIDQPARQVVIEALVLEISETGLDQLGVRWQLQTPNGTNAFDNLTNLQLGRLPQFDDNNGPTVSVGLDDVFGEFQVQVQALIQEGQAQILSRPSVLTLDNRQAFIRVGEDIPVATGAAGLDAGDKLSFDFEYIPVGIRLNVRPRVAADGQEVSLQVDGSVSAEVPGQDLVLRDQEGNVLARAPRLSKREVQAYTRIANNTPFIIGGLVSQDRSETVEKVPILGDIPIIKYLFRNTTIDTLKREVIIVITPYVLPERQVVGRNLPKDDDIFDSFGNQLFRDAYRIRTEDVFDLQFLTSNRRLQQLQSYTEEVVRRMPDLRNEYPFNLFYDRKFPGEQILVYRQMYEVIQRQNLSEDLDADKLIFFQPDRQLEQIGTFGVEFLTEYLRERTLIEEEAPLGRAFAELQDRGQSIALTYTRDRYSQDPDEMLSEPVPEVRMVDTPTREAWQQVLWELNQPDEQGRLRYTILLNEVDDLVRLERAVLLKRTVELNASRESLSLDNFSVGRLLLLPTVDSTEVKLIDADVARYFFYTEQYYQAVRQLLIRDGGALWDILQEPRFRRLLDSPSATDRPLQWDSLPE